MNETTVTMTGNVVSDPVVRITKQGGRFVTFRLASTARRYNGAEGRYVDAGTNFVDVTAFRQLGQNVAMSVSKGQPVVVTGRLRINAWQKEERRGLSVSIDAHAVGHDLARGCSHFLRVRPGHDGEGSNPLVVPGEAPVAMGPVSEDGPLGDAEPGAGWLPSEADFAEYDGEEAALEGERDFLAAAEESAAEPLAV